MGEIAFAQCLERFQGFVGIVYDVNDGKLTGSVRNSAI
jgi:hypothetical protein